MVEEIVEETFYKVMENKQKDKSEKNKKSSDRNNTENDEIKIPMQL